MIKETYPAPQTVQFEKSGKMGSVQNIDQEDHYTPSLGTIRFRLQIECF
jgi:hypothetical protein